MSNTHPQAIAIVGAAGRFPHARNLAEFWQRLQAGEELVTFFSDEELLRGGIDPALLQNPNYVRARAVLEDAELFDALFFGVNPREAEVLDPQQRVFLETAWEALEDAGCDPEGFAGAIGIYAGLSMNSYIFNNLLPRPDVLQQVGGYQLMLASDKDFLATRAAYKLNLRGPSVTVQTACSTSLVAVQLACQSLLSYQCDVALAGGVSISTPRVGGYVYQPGMILSPDGHCRPFDARGRGIVAGEGAGIVVLKRLSDALAAGDSIRAVILGAAINNDGADKVGYTAPSVQGQAEVIAMAQAMAGVSPDTIQYVEAHGTGTELGDPIEIAALTQAFRLGTARCGYCAVGSVKSNMGHLDAAAGVAGLIKAMLALQHRQIPPSLHVEQPNPQIDFAGSPFYVATRLEDWPQAETPRRAGVSSFGIGGTNAHVVLEEAPALKSEAALRRHHLLLLSAVTPAALDAATAALAAHLETHQEQELADVAYTLQTGRKAFNQRRVLVCADRAEAITRLAGSPEQPLPSAAQEMRQRPVAFLFPGQGSQYPGMGRDLYATEAVFRRVVDACAEILQPHLGLDLRHLLFPPPGQDEDAAAQLRRTALTQPALFVVEYALAQLWLSWGMTPAAMIGHSIGEYVAACLAGVFSLPDALALVAARGALMQSLPAGSMLAVSLSTEGLAPYLDAELALAAVNAPQMCVVSGPTPAIDALERRLGRDGVQGQRLHTSHAFHSAMMDPILHDFTALVAGVPRQAPALPYLSNVTGTWITPAEATDPAYWAHHLRSTVHFALGVGELLRTGDMALLEVGPSHTLAALARQHTAYTPAHTVLGSMRHPHDRTSDDRFLLQTAGNLWLAGVVLDWSAFNAHELRCRVPLPTYPFERARYWVEAPAGGAARSAQQAAGAGGLPMTAQAASLPPGQSATLPAAPAKRPDLADWFYVPTWKRQNLLRGEPQQAPLCWLLFADSDGLGTALSARLQTEGHKVVIVTAGEAYAAPDTGEYQIAPAAEADYRMLLADLRRRNFSPDRIVHLWNANRAASGQGPDAVEGAQECAFYSLLALSQALAEPHNNRPVRLEIVVSGLCDVLGDEPLAPARATLLGPGRVIAQELPHVASRVIDIVVPAGELPESLAGQLLTELQAVPQASAAASIVALRGRHRWVQDYEPLPLPAPVLVPELLRPHGVYLITGGLGGLGLAFAELLAHTVAARLVLTGRTPLPPRKEWDTWLVQPDKDNPTRRKIAAVQALEALGAQVLVVAADVADAAQTAEAVAAAHSVFGPIDGVIHAAGVAGGGIIPLKTRAMAAGVLAPKVKGTAVLAAALANEPLRFMVLCSSFNAMLGGVGQVDYTAANTFLDAFAQAQARRGGPLTISINWGTWQEVGMAVDTAVPEQWRQAKEANLRLGLRSAEGQEALLRMLANPLPQWVVSPQDLHELLARSTARDEAPGAGTVLQASLPAVAQVGASTGAQPGAVANGPARHARPPLPTPYAAPCTALETELAEVWAQLFGIDRIGRNDNFFELGGHSLLATQILVRLQERFGVELPVRTIFEAHTIAELAARLDVLVWAADNQRLPVTAGDADREEVEF